MLTPAGSGEMLSGAPETASASGSDIAAPTAFPRRARSSFQCLLSLRPLWVYFLHRLSQVAVAVFRYCLTSAECGKQSLGFLGCDRAHAT